jgi:lipoprotein-anchoring transpeptidase ErfK/SrfK
MQTLPQESYSGPRRHPPGSNPGELPELARDRFGELLPEDLPQDALTGPDPEEIIGFGGLLAQLAGRMLGAALQGELTDHLGYSRGQAPPGGAGNTRSGATVKTVHTDIGPVEVRTPRDRNGTFAPKLVSKRQTRLAGLDDRILGMYAGGLAVAEVSAYLQELYGGPLGRGTISRVTDSVLEDISAWRARPLDPSYPIVYFKSLVVTAAAARSAATHACCVGLGVRSEGEREVLGLWWQRGGDAELWPTVLAELRQRGVEDILVARVDGLTGLSEAISASETWVHPTEHEESRPAAQPEAQPAAVPGTSGSADEARDRARGSWSLTRIPFPVALVAVMALAAAAGSAISNAFSTAPASAVSGSASGSSHHAAGAAHRASTRRGWSYVAVAKYGELTVYTGPRSPKKMLALGKPTATQPLTLLVKQRRADWVQTYLPTRPDGSLGWVRMAAIRLVENPWAVVVRLRSHRLVVRRAARVVRTLPIAVGKPSTPTPTGHYFLTELLKQPDPGGAYGPYAFGTSDYSNVLLHFGTGDGQIGIHGTDQPWVIGTSASHGCIRLYNRDIVWLSERLPLGTPVQVAG